MTQKTYAFLMEGQEDLRFPYVEIGEKQVKYHPGVNGKFRCWQPDHLDDAEFNLILLLEGCPVLARSCHFDFETVND